VLLPSVVLALIVLAFSFFGDGLRDAFDPRSKD
jgi:peptide/nickel transport system permease protein